MPDTTSSSAPPSRILDLFDAQARATPNAIAVSSEQRFVTYTNLLEQSHRVALYLQAAGLQAEELVALFMERSPEAVVAILGILRAGGAYLPIDPSYPEQRIRFLFEDSRVRFVAADPLLRRRIPSESSALVFDPSSIIDVDGQLTFTPRLERHLAYVIYTSGTTGKPKGVQVEHKGLCNLIQQTKTLLCLDSESKFLQFSSLSFDASVWEIFGAICTGATLHIEARDRLLPGEALAQTLLQSRITHALLPPSALTELGAGDFPELKVLIVGGEEFPTKLARYWSSRLTLYNAYGPTEATVCTTMFKCEDIENATPIGRPIGNMQVHVLDYGLNPVDPGGIGEIYIGGLGVARGYLGRPELTKERFVLSHLGEAAEATLYRTGDFARVMGDGNLEFAGRKDSQVKIRGFRIELEEIERAIMQYAAVTGACVVAQERELNERTLVAYLTASEEMVNPSRIREHLLCILPHYMIPSRFVQLQRFPLTPNGKIDRSSLSLLTENRDGGEGDDRLPSGSVEERLATILAELLHCGSVGTHANFFQVGGDSLVAARMISRVSVDFGVRLSLSDIFRAETVDALAQLIRTRTSETRISAAMLGDAPPEPGSLSSMQKGLWFLSKHGGQSRAYTVPFGLRLRGELRRDLLRSAIASVVNAHELLRSAFPSQAEKCRRHVISEPAGLLEVKRLPEGGDPTLFAEQLEWDATPNFDIERGPLVKWTLWEFGPNNSVLSVTIHHLIFDGISMPLLVQQLADAYGSLLNGIQGSAIIPFPYDQFVAHEHRIARDATYPRKVEFWRSYLMDAPRLDLPRDLVRPGVPSTAGRTLDFEVDSDLTQALRDMAASRSTTMYQVLLSAFVILLKRHSQTSDVVIGAPVAIRPPELPEDAVGLFLNTIVWRVAVSEEDTVIDVLDKVRSLAVDIFANCDVPFQQIVEAAAEPRAMLSAPLFDVMFNFVQYVHSIVRFGEIEAEPFMISNGASKYDLTLTIDDAGARLHGILEFRTDSFSAEMVEDLAVRFRLILRECTRGARVPVGAMCLLGPGQRQRIEADWSQGPVEASPGRALPDIIVARAVATPMATAVVSDDGELSYLGLENRANQIAQFLRARGVTPGARVGVLLRRSATMVAVLLGIMKAGAAYVPLDARYPADRVEFLMKHSAAQLVLCDRDTRIQFSNSALPIVDLDAERHAIDACVTTSPDLVISPKDIAYIIYTSGSTGRPKGVLITHANVVNLVEWAVKQFSIQELRMVLASTALVFDLSVFEIFVPLSAGTTVVICENLLTWITSSIRQEVTLVNSVPSVVKQALTLNPLPSGIIAVILAGETLTRELADQIYAGGATAVYNLYAPAETTTYSTCEKVLVGERARPSIGRPIANTEVYLLDGYGGLVPPGIPGEIYIAGSGVARGYLNEQALTEERFIRRVVGPGPARRLYRTGDVGRLRRDGRIEFLGRRDSQVKVRGHRIELEELDAVLAAHASIGNACVVVSLRDDGTNQLVAYVTRRDGHALDSGTLRTFCLAKLPQYVVPSRFFEIKEMPLTPGGKIDRIALASIEAEVIPPAATQSDAAARTDLERTIAEIWRRVLRIHEFGFDQNFFELGGDSLTIVGVYEQLQRSFPTLPIRITDVFAHSTIRALARFVDERLVMSSVSRQLIARSEGNQNEIGRRSLAERASLRRSARDRARKSKGDREPS
jgi:amino acid adenylation domain-containing protein